MQGNSPDIKSYVDLDAAMNRMRGNKKLYRRMLALFQANTDYEGFEASYAKQDMEQATVHIHTLKGVTGNLSLTPLFDVSTELLGELRNGAPKQETIDQLGALYAGTKTAVDALIKELDAELA